MKKAILVISFGTSYLKQKAESIDPCVEAIRKAFKDWDIYETFSSRCIRKKLREEKNLELPSPEEIIEALHGLGYKKVIIQPLFLIEGIEYNKLIELAKRYEPLLDIQVGKALLSSKEEYKVLVEELEVKYQGHQTQFLVLGHGSSHEAHVSYKLLQEALDKTSLKAYVTTLGDRKNLHALPLEPGASITLIPFMLVAGNHILKDVLSSDEDSWVSGLTKLGYKVEVVLRGLGSYESTQKIYIRHIQTLL